jgi:hypothetical protein
MVTRMTPSPKEMEPDLARVWRSVMFGHRPSETIHEFAEKLVRLVHYRDGDKREIGFDYEYIRNAILRRFPTVKVGGPHKGRQTKMPYKELQKVTGELNRAGVKLPFRPRRKATKKTKKKSSS